MFIPAQAPLAHAAQQLLADHVGEGLGPVQQLAGPHPPPGAQPAALPRAAEPLQRRRLHAAATQNGRPPPPRHAACAAILAPAQWVRVCAVGARPPARDTAPGRD